MGKQKQPRFKEEFKREAVRILMTSGRTVAEVADDLGVGKSTLGKEIFSANMGPSVSANPYLAFYFKVPGAGDMTFTWTEDGGKQTAVTKKIKVA